MSFETDENCTIVLTIFIYFEEKLYYRKLYFYIATYHDLIFAQVRLDLLVPDYQRHFFALIGHFIQDLLQFRPLWTAFLVAKNGFIFQREIRRVRCRHDRSQASGADSVEQQWIDKQNENRDCESRESVIFIIIVTIFTE